MHTAAELFRQSTQTIGDPCAVQRRGSRDHLAALGRGSDHVPTGPRHRHSRQGEQSQGARGHGAPALGGASRRADHGRGRFPEKSNPPPGFDFAAPAGTPKACRRQPSTAPSTDSGAARFRERPAGMGGRTDGGTPAEFATFLDAEIKKWGEVVPRRRSRDRVSASVMPAAKTALVIGGSGRERRHRRHRRPGAHTGDAGCALRPTKVEPFVRACARSRPCAGDLVLRGRPGQRQVDRRHDEPRARRTGTSTS